MKTRSFKYARYDAFGLLRRGKIEAESKRQAKQKLGVPWWSSCVWPSGQTGLDSFDNVEPASILPRFRHIQTTPEMILYGKAGLDSIVPGVALLILGFPCVFLPIPCFFRLVGILFVLIGVAHLCRRIEMKIHKSPALISVKKTQCLSGLIKEEKISISPASVILERDFVFLNGDKCVYDFVSIRNKDGSVVPVDCSSNSKFEKKMAHEIATFFDIPVEKMINPGAYEKPSL